MCVNMHKKFGFFYRVKFLTVNLQMVLNYSISDTTVFFFFNYIEDLRPECTPE